MVTIEKIKRAYKIETEEEFIKGIKNLCNAIGEENIISVQFLNGERNEIDRCILTYKE